MFVCRYLSSVLSGGGGAGQGSDDDVAETVSDRDKRVRKINHAKTLKSFFPIRVCVRVCAPDKLIPVCCISDNTLLICSTLGTEFT